MEAQQQEQAQSMAREETLPATHRTAGREGVREGSATPSGPDPSREAFQAVAGVDGMNRPQGHAVHEPARSMAWEEGLPATHRTAGRDGVREGIVTPYGPDPSRWTVHAPADQRHTSMDIRTTDAAFVRMSEHELAEREHTRRRLQLALIEHDESYRASTAPNCRQEEMRSYRDRAWAHVVTTAGHHPAQAPPTPAGLFTRADNTTPVCDYTTHAAERTTPLLTGHPGMPARAAAPALGHSTLLAGSTTLPPEHTTQPGYVPHTRYSNAHVNTAGGELTYPGQYSSTTLNESQRIARKGVNRDLPSFSGAIEEWPLFIATYNSTNNACGYSDAENTIRLQHALKGAARETVGHLLSFPAGLNDVIATLKARFGRPDLIVEHMIEKVRKMATPRIERLETIVEFGYAVKRLIAAVQASGVQGFMYDVALLKELVRKVPSVLVIDWVRHKKTLPEVTLLQFGEWCGELADDLCSVVDSPVIGTGKERIPERIDRSKPLGLQRFKPHNADQERRLNQGPFGTRAYTNAHVERKEPIHNMSGFSQCFMCGGQCTSLAKCNGFLASSVAARRAVINQGKFCRKCLGAHKTRCSVSEACGVHGCEAMHHAMLHLDYDDAGSKARGRLEAINHHTTNQSQALLKYLPITLHGPKGSVEVYALLDDGSTSTFMEHTLLNELGLTGTPSPLCLQWTGDVTREEKDSVRLAVQVTGRNKSSPVYELTDVHTVRELALPSQTMCMSEMAQMYLHLRGIPAESYRDAIPRVLIGINNCRFGQTLRSVEGEGDEPVASKTRLGWVIGGPCSARSRAVVSPLVAFHACERSADDKLIDAVKEHFAIESLGILRPARSVQSKEDERARMLLDRETRYIGERYETGLLWRSDDVKLPCNKASALKRYVCLKRKLEKDPVLAKAVAAKMQEYVTKGYIRRLSHAETTQKHTNDWYLPVFPVTNPNKPGKIRMVFDAAAKVSGVSLNSYLLTGPDLLASLLSVLFKFREHRVGFTGDIREMFHQVAMRKQDQRSQMILWDGDEPDGDPAVYAMTVMTFGAACSPTSAQYVKNRNADRFAEHHPRAVACIKNEHYVDDLLASVETDQEAIELAETVRYIHGKGGFDIRNWISNSRAVSERLHGDPGDGSVNMNHGSDTEKVLGMWWHTSTDVFTFRLSPKLEEVLPYGSKPVTKRELLRTQMSVYDPMGLLGHFIMYIKVLLQEVWRGGYGWDQQIDERMSEKWKIWLRVLPDVEKVAVPRCYRKLTSALARVELHVFCDASENGMAAVAYFRFNEGGVIECSLVGAKTRVAPLKFVSIPRLELQAAVIGARLATAIHNSHRIHISRTIFWTDSRNVLSWLYSDHRRYNQFVAFRVGEILEITEAERWRWIPTKLNVADDGTKWTKPLELSPETRWFRGPSFLWGNESDWPAQEQPTKNTTDELRASVSHHRMVDSVIQFERFSRWRRALRTLAYVRRFATNTRSRARHEQAQTGPLTQEELAWAEREMIKAMQREAYQHEIRQLGNKEKKYPWQKGVDKSSPLYKLSPILDDTGMLRVGGRLSDCAGIAEPLRAPIILPRNHHGTDLLIQDYHERHKHCCHSTVINEIRSRYHVPRLLTEYRRVRNRCQRCKIINAAPEPPLMGVIPYQRVAVGQPAFTFTGIDYFGPIMVAIGRRVEKRWGVIFTCLTSRAVHLETAHSLTTASCILAIRRFIARRGTPREILSDRGTNFVGASRELADAIREVDNHALMEEFTGTNTKWIFNPPGAPHFGGCWERLVQSVKKVLARFEFPRRPTDEVLTSTLTEIERILNSRPLTYVPMDNELEGPITPNHLLLGSSDGSKPPVIFCDEAAALRSSWKAAQRNADLFWQKWIAEYLPTLTRRSKWFEPVRPIAEGDLVVIVDGGLPRNCWPRGRVTTVVRARDGQVRQATVRTAGGIYVRPAHKLALLDVARS